ncbi:MAG: PrpF domain-containing protein [Desulfobacteraceae bacterium]|jgi:2-methylaconitate cis-trans-isomerase PrpF
MQKRIPTVLMRGGTSKGLFFHDNHLPADHGVRSRVILAAFGSPDPSRRQIDGVGGGVSTTSKVAIISPSEQPDYDVVYNFGQVSLDRPMVDFKGNCGNISSAVGPFAVDEGLVKAVEPITRVRIHQKNTDKLITAEVPVKNGRFDHCGDYAIAGVPGTHSRITLGFADPGGSLTGKLFPTGNHRDTIEVPNHGSVPVTIIDAANPVILVPAEAVGLTGIEIDEIDTGQEIKATLETIRCKAAVMIGLAASEQEATRQSQAVPKIAFIAPPRPYTTTGGQTITTRDIDITARIMSMGTLHRSYAVSGGISTAGAAMIPGTVAHPLVSEPARQNDLLRIGHPGGAIDIGAAIDIDGDRCVYRQAVIGRTARRLMEGHVLVPEACFN